MKTHKAILHLSLHSNRPSSALLYLIRLPTLKLLKHRNIFASLNSKQYFFSQLLDSCLTAPFSVLLRPHTRRLKIHLTGKTNDPTTQKILARLYFIFFCCLVRMLNIDILIICPWHFELKKYMERNWNSQYNSTFNSDYLFGLSSHKIFSYPHKRRNLEK